MGMLDGKVAIVSGVGPGMGRDISLALAREGADIVMTARRLETMEAVAKEVQKLGRTAVPVRCDITNVDDCAHTVDVATRELGGVDILVNIAHHSGDMKSTMDADLDVWRQAFETNFFGTVQLTRACVPSMQARGEGRVIMINTQSTLWTKPNYGAYASSKAALAQITKTLARELGPIGIRVNGIHPGFIWGAPVQGFLQRQADARGVPFETVYGELADETCLKYIPSSEEIAGSVVFLASPLAKPVTGQWFAVNAGHYLV